MAENSAFMDQTKDLFTQFHEKASRHVAKITNEENVDVAALFCSPFPFPSSGVSRPSLRWTLNSPSDEIFIVGCFGGVSICNAEAFAIYQRRWQVDGIVGC